MIVSFYWLSRPVRARTRTRKELYSHGHTTIVTSGPASHHSPGTHARTRRVRSRLRFGADLPRPLKLSRSTSRLNKKEPTPTDRDMVPPRVLKRKWSCFTTKIRALTRVHSSVPFLFLVTPVSTPTAEVLSSTRPRGSRPLERRGCSPQAPVTPVERRASAST